jgi:hypothetical protein
MTIELTVHTPVGTFTSAPLVDVVDVESWETSLISSDGWLTFQDAECESCQRIFRPDILNASVITINVLSEKDTDGNG